MNTISRVGIGVVMVGAVTAFGACGARGMKSNGPEFRGTKKIVYATIYLTPYSSGTKCAATAVPGRIQVKKNEDVEWSMVDFCGITEGYTKDFSLQWRALDGANCADGTQVPVNSTVPAKTHMRRAINSQCDEGKVFKYDIFVETTKVADPELEIAQ